MKIRLSVSLIWLPLTILFCGTTFSQLSKKPVVFGVSQNIVPVLINKKDNPVIRIQLPVYSSTDQVLTEVTISLKGTTDLNDIRSLRLFYTGSSAQFGTKNLFATAAVSNRLVVFKGELKLPMGTNYLWLSAELNSTAGLLHHIDAVPIRLMLNGKVYDQFADFAKNDQRIGIALRNAGDDKIASYRIPGLTTTKTGSLIAVYDIRHNNSADLQEDIDVGMSRSVDGGQKWEPMKTIMDMGTYGNKPQDQNGIGDPSVLVDTQTGDIWVAALWLHGFPKQRAWNASKPGLTPDETGQLMLSRSSDDGKTWSSPINITAQVKDPSWQLCFQGPGRGITMADGTLVFPAQYKDSSQLPHATILYSKDHGVSWKMGKAAYPNTTEAQVVETEPGTLLLNMRDNRGGLRTIFTTKDLGKSWTEHPSSRSALQEPVCNASILKTIYNGKPVLFFVNPNAVDGRHHMTLKASLDMGLTWPVQYQLLLDELTGNGYPSLTAIDKDHIGIVYEGSQANLVFEKIGIRDILHQ